MIKEIKRKTSKLTIHITKNQMPTIAMVYHTTQAVQIIRDLSVPIHSILSNSEIYVSACRSGYVHATLTIEGVAPTGTWTYTSLWESIRSHK